MRHLIAVACLLSAPAWAQGAAPSRVTPSGGNVAIGGAAAVVIPALASPTTSVYAIRYQVQGVGYACVSWATAAVTITGTDGTAKCGGAGTFLVTAGSVDARVFPAPIPTTALFGIAATGASLVLSYEVE